MNANPAIPDHNNSSDSVVIPLNLGTHGHPRAGSGTPKTAHKQHTNQHTKPKEFSVLVQNKHAVLYFRGKNWNFRKRKPEGRWVLELRVPERQIRTNVSLEVADLPSIEQAKNWIDAAQGGNTQVMETLKKRHDLPVEMAVERKAIKDLPNCGKYFAMYEASKDLDVDDDVRKANVQALRNAIRRSLKMPLPEKTTTFPERRALEAEIDQMPPTIFTEKLARDYYRVARADAAIMEDAEGEDAGNKVRRTRQSLLMQGISVFTELACRNYTDAGLKLPPDLEKFMAACKLEANLSTRVPYNPPDSAIIDKTLHEWTKIKDRNLYMAIGVELSLGTRAEETSQLRRKHIVSEYKMPQLRAIGIDVKDGTGRAIVHPIDPFCTVMMRRIKREGWTWAPEDYLVQGNTATDRDAVFRAVGVFMRSCGWDTEKTNHALRAYSGCLIYMKIDPNRASWWLRHKNLKTTQKDYSHYVTTEGMLFPRKIRCRFSRRLWT